MGYEDYEGWMTVAAHMVTDFYLTPLLRDRYGVGKHHRAGITINIQKAFVKRLF